MFIYKKPTNTETTEKPKKVTKFQNASMVDHSWG